MRNAFLASPLALGAPVLLALASPVAAQNVGIDVRVDRLEKEMRAVQRKVFPAGAPLEAEITRPAAPAVVPGSPSSTPVADLTARVNALESQLASVTGQVEKNSFKLKQLEEAFNRYKAEQESRAAQVVVPPAVRPADPAPAATRPAAPKPAANGASEERKAAVAGIERPSTGNEADDAYTYGFRLWGAKFYPEAQAQLKSTVDKYGSSPVASKAANLLGRAYLDDGKPALASVAFYENYQKRPKGDRAADSLAYLGEALIQLKKPADACKVYSELEQVYGASLSASLRGMMDKGRARAKCSA
ncbi:tol-pal system YbgF family protein [Sphingobium sp. EM0848]|uniref:tetratricopeptide repeat protein n=1 Tax=Sphingobium sp. EM0848 TaxID=2743473 RepID=UPI00159C0A16|nr:tetratricopeptide repeat protein [Sphingobium sp. EM0848]